MYNNQKSPRSRSGGIVAGLLGALLALAVAAPASAGPNLLSNSSFETGDFSGWTQGGDTGFTFVTCGVLHSDGNCAALLGATGQGTPPPPLPYGTLSQNVNLAVGTTYVLTFSLFGVGDNPSNFSAFLGNTQIANVANPNTGGGFQNFLAFVTATTTANTLQLRFSDVPGFMWVDNVQFAAPEPASIALVGLALAGLGFMRRRRG